MSEPSGTMKKEAPDRAASDPGLARSGERLLGVNAPVMRKGRLRFGILLGVFFASAFVFVFYAVPLLTPLPENLDEAQDSSTVVTDREDRELRRFLVNGESVISDYASLEEIPEALIYATVAAEDKRFWRHHGLDFAATLRAALDAWQLGYQVSGASTITQQLIKLTSEPRPRTLRTKVIEILGARKVEILRDKEWILENYLNRLPYGNMRTGCRAASEGYFDKPLADLSIAEAAFLAGLPNKPTRFNPYTNFEGAKERQIWILDRMYEDGYITRDALERARSEKLVIVPRGSSFRAPHAVDLMVAHYGDGLPPGRVASTLDLDLQAAAQQAIDDHLRFIALHRSTSPYLHAAVVAIENATGEVRILTGSRDYESGHSGQVNGAWAARSPGSALKPFTYLLALEQGFPACTVLPDVAMEFPTATGLYRPVNYDRTFAGPVLIREALGNSLNLPAVRMLQDLGGPEALYEALRRLGISTLDKPAGHYGLGLTIGSAEVRLLELTNAYACLARLGEWKPWRLFPADGPVESPETDGDAGRGRRLFRPETTYIIADMMSDPAARARSFGWNSPIRIDAFRAAAKTGTSSDYRDAWALGFTPEYTVGVWVGNFDNSPLDHFSGAAGAGPIFRAVLERLHGERPATWYEQPRGVGEIEVDPFSGHMAWDGFRPRRLRRELVVQDALPPLARAEDYDARGRTLIPAVYANWHGSAARLRQYDVAVRPPQGQTDFAILSPVAGMVVFLDPDIKNHGQILHLTADLGSSVRWSSPTLEIDPIEATARLVPGEHEVTAEDPESGLRKSVHFIVRGT